MRKSINQILFTIASVLVVPALSLAGPGFFSYEGRLFDSGGNPQTGSAFFTVRIYNPSQNCFIYQEDTA